MNNDWLPPAPSEHEIENLMRMLDPVSPLDFLADQIREDWLWLCIKLRCDIAAA